MRQLPPYPGLELDRNVATYRAAPGEVNTLRLLPTRNAIEGGSRLVVYDATAPLTAGSGCTSLDVHTADCRPPARPAGFFQLELETDVRLGDRGDRAEVATSGPGAEGRFDLWGEGGNDRLSIPSYRYFYGDLRGGPGNDVLHGFGSSHLLDGGPGADEIVGGRGSDTLRDGDRDGAPAPDTIDGGGGRGSDALDYSSHSRPVRVDLATGRGGLAAKGDKLARIEEVIGGRGNDVLLGGPRGEALDGRDGINVVAGRGGNDRLTVGEGGTTSGGAGNDRLAVGDTANVFCGAGRDDQVHELGRPTDGLKLVRDCELLVHNPEVTDTPTGLYVDPRARLNGRRLRLQLTCGDCTQGRVEVTSARRPFRTHTRGRFHLRPRGEPDEYAGSAAVSLPADVAARGRGRPLRFVVRSRGDLGGDYLVVWRIRVAPTVP